MRKYLKKLPPPATVIASLALLAALTGTSVAAVSAIPRNSIGAAQIKNNAVTSSEVKNFSLLRVDFKRGQLPAGATGARGPQGPAGPAGAAGISGLERKDAITPMTSANSKTLSAVCPTGKKVIGGGARSQGAGLADVVISESFPDSDGTKWNALARESDPTAAAWALQVYALCAVVAA